MEQEQQEEVITTTPTEQQEEEESEVQPTKSVKNFWERLDEVFTQNTELRERMEELVDQFPDTQRISTETYKSFIFQPERVAISSNDDVNVNAIATTTIGTVGPDGILIASGGHEIAETFSQFRVRFQRSLVNVKSIQLLSAVIPNAIQNIPNNQLVFFYYRIQSLATSASAYNPATTYNQGDTVTYLTNYYACIVDGTLNILPTNSSNWALCGDPLYSPTTTYNIGDFVTYQGNSYICTVNGTINIVPTTTSNWTFRYAIGYRPNYFQISVSTLNAVFIRPTNGETSDRQSAIYDNVYNRTYQDYNDLVSTLNACASNPNQKQGTAPVGSISFAFNQQLNKIQMIPNADQITAGYYFFPAGYEDPNINTFMTDNYFILDEGLINYTPGYTLNLRLGFTWNGVFTSPFMANPYLTGSTGSCRNALYWYMRPSDPYYAISSMTQNLTTANNYGDLVNTSCVRLYCDVSLASTDDSSNQQGLLSIVPVNTTNLGVGFYQNNFSNPLTKIPKIISEIGIRLVNDQGLPFVLPNSATVLLELAITYH